VRIPTRRNTERFRGLATAWALAVSLLVAGCGNPGEGTVHVSPETRARLTSPFGPDAKDFRRRPIGSKKVGIKDRVSGLSRMP
jgi:hypothetical protein